MSSRDKTQILIIEDNPGDAHLVRIYLREAGLKHDLHHAESFFEGQTIADEKPIDLVLLDLSLPDSHGFKTLSNFIKRFAHIPIIVLTGLNDEVVGNQAIKAGAQDYLVKGQFESNLLARVIRYSLQRFKTQQSLEQSTKKLAQSEKRFMEAQEMAHFGNWEMDIVTNEMKWSEEVFRIFGFNPNSLQPTLSDYMGYVYSEDKTLVEDTFSAVTKNGQLQKIEYRIVLGGTKVKYLVNQIKIQYDEEAERILLVGALQDITEHIISRKLTEEKNISDKAFKIKEQILEDMSFHIRTPLSSVLNLSFLIENTSLSRQQSEYVDNLKDAINDLSISVNNLMNFSVLVSNKVNLEESQFKLEDIIESVKQVVQIKADNKNIKVKFEIKEGVADRFIGDANKINQVIYNLLDNGIKFSEKDSEVIVSISLLEANTEKAKIKIAIKDTGIGIPKNKINSLLESEELLFQNYEEGESQRKLGLAIVTKLVKNMEGELHIESNEGQGSTFSIDLPLKVVKIAKRTTASKPSNPLRILLVEDHFLNQLATKRVLTTWSDFVSVDIAENGLVGVEKMRAHKYDLILMDLQMPVMNGFDATTKIRETSKVPIIALSANSSHQEAEKTKAVGMNDYMSKPFKPQGLYEKIMMVLHGEED